MPVRATFRDNVPEAMRNEIEVALAVLNSSGAYKTQYSITVSYSKEGLPKKHADNPALSAICNGHKDIVINPDYGGDKSIADRFYHEIIHVIYPGISGGDGIGEHALGFYKAHKKLYDDLKLEYDIKDSVYETDSVVYKRLMEAQCFLKGTRIAVGNNDYKYIEDIKVGDRVLSYDSRKSDSCELIEKKVTRIFRGSTKKVICLRGLYCTPGHVFLTMPSEFSADISFEKISTILKKDGVIIDRSGAIKRARTGAVKNSEDDRLIKVVAKVKSDDAKFSEDRHFVVRAGIPVMFNTVSQSKNISVVVSLRQYMAQAGIEISPDGMLIDKNGNIYSSCDWPVGSTPLDTQEGQNWTVEADGRAFMPQWMASVLDCEDVMGLTTHVFN